MDTEVYFDKVFRLFQETVQKEGKPLPSVSTIAQIHGTPYTVLISTIISLRTKDSVTLAASERLFERASTPEAMVKLSAEEIGELIKPAGFFKRKGEQIRRISEILLSDYNGEVPMDMDKLLALPGVGLKTASLVLNLGFGIDAICVDCHVHEIVNRMGWICTKTPEDSERELRKILPRRFWIPLNELLVSYGQKVCTPVSPFCSKCPMDAECPKVGVTKTR